MKGLYRVALVFGLAAFGATSLGAAEIDPPTDEMANAVRVVNNYGEMVRVYAEDGEGRLHNLGRVARGELKEFEIPEAVVGQTFRIKVFPAQPVWAPLQDDFGVKSNPIDLAHDAEVTFWVEPELENSVVELARG